MLILQYDFSPTTTAQLFGIAASPITLFSAVSLTSSLFSGTSYTPTGLFSAISRTSILFSGTSHTHHSIFSCQSHQQSIFRHQPRPPVYFQLSAAPAFYSQAPATPTGLFSATPSFYSHHAHQSIFSYQPHQHSILRHPPRPPVYFQPHHHSILITPTSLFPAISHTSILFSSRPPVYFRLSATPALYSHHAHRSIPSCQPHKHSILRHLLLTLPIWTRLFGGARTCWKVPTRSLKTARAG